MYQQPYHNQFPQGQPPQSPLNNPYAAWQAQAAFSKSFTTPAVLCLVLYCVFWIPGLIANVVYLIDADKAKRLTGVNPDGYGCLWALLIVVAILPLLMGALFTVTLIILPALFAVH